jgi:hypothetical protein
MATATSHLTPAYHHDCIQEQWLSWLTQILLQVSTAMEIYVQQQTRPAQGHPCTTTILPQAGFLAAVTAPILAATCPAPA